MRINEVEKAVGIPKTNIRFYEEQGLLSPRREPGNGYRDYSEADVRTLQIIRLLRKMAVPLEEIRRLQTGVLSLSDSMARHRIYLNSQLENLMQIQAACQTLEESGETLATLDVTQWESHIEALEKGGTKFMNVSQDKRKKKTGPIVAAAVWIAFFAAILALMIWGYTVDPIPWPIIALLAGIMIALICGVLLALRERMKEIDGGEEDEAVKY